ncbi:MAG: toast rack family protein [Anaerolineae bacterium]
MNAPRRVSAASLARTFALGVALVMVLSGCMIPIPEFRPLTQIDLVEQVETVDRAGATWATVRLRLVSEELVVRAAGDVDLLRGTFRYNVEEWAPKIEQTTAEGETRVTVGQGLGSQIPLGKGDTYTNRWEIGLAPGIPLDLGVDMGAGEASLDLTGLSLRRLAVTSAGTDVSLAFNAPNPEPLGTLRLTGGAGKVVATGLGNANFDHLTVFGGAGAMDLDFNGAFRRSVVADIKAGAGSVTIRVPADIGVRITFSGIPLGQVDTVGLTEQTENVYVNAAYGEAPLTLTISLTSGVGAISLISQ